MNRGQEHRQQLAEWGHQPACDALFECWRNWLTLRFRLDGRHSRPATRTPRTGHHDDRHASFGDGPVRALFAQDYRLWWMGYDAGRARKSGCRRRQWPRWWLVCPSLPFSSSCIRTGYSSESEPSWRPIRPSGGPTGDTTALRGGLAADGCEAADSDLFGRTGSPIGCRSPV
jgi:hypothetical protein